MLTCINQALDGVTLTDTSHCLLVGIGGTATTLAAVDQGLIPYNPQRINNYVLKKERIQAIQDRFLCQTHIQRRKTPGLEPGREDVIVSGTALQLCIMDKFGYERLTVCDSGLREGIVLNCLDEHFA
jgi:exopolyphosphatase/guanosine-5'-triphosphate,3'-diphosphate pyrophosphatase